MCFTRRSQVELHHGKSHPSYLQVKSPCYSLFHGGSGWGSWQKEEAPSRGNWLIILSNPLYCPTCPVRAVVGHHINRCISGQKYKFPAFTGKITHTHTVCTWPWPFLLKGPGYEATTYQEGGRIWCCAHTGVVPVLSCYACVQTSLVRCSLVA